MKKLQIYKMFMLVLIAIIGLSGCKKDKTEVVVDETPPQVISQTNLSETTSVQSESSYESSSGDYVPTSEDVKIILLKDSDGKIIKSEFTENEMNEILDTLYNSIQLEESVPEVLEGNTLTLVLDEGPIVFIQSYNGKDRVVMTVDNEEVYHLECKLVAQLLLNQ